MARVHQLFSGVGMLVFFFLFFPPKIVLLILEACFVLRNISFWAIVAVSFNI